MNEDIPGWVTMFREDLQDFRVEVRSAVQNMATKEALAAHADQTRERVVLLEAKITQERDARIAEQKERAAKTRRMVGAIWAVLGTVIVVFGPMLISH